VKLSVLGGAKQVRYIKNDAVAKGAEITLFGSFVDP
jgi:hypothetical protein